MIELIKIESLILVVYIRNCIHNLDMDTGQSRVTIVTIFFNFPASNSFGMYVHTEDYSVDA